MIDGLGPYPAYRDSGVPWLGRMPEHWEVRRLRNVAEMRVSSIDKHTTDGEEPVRLCNYVDVYKNERITERLKFMRATASTAEIKRFRLERGDVLLTKDSESWTDIAIPSLVEHTAPDLVCGYHLALLRPYVGIMRGAYLLRATQSRGVAYQFHIEANGVTRYGLSHSAIKSIVLPVPSDDEQLAIARFLNHADRRIRRYIRIKQKLIALLEEQKQAIIQQAVTRGLDPNIPLKPSGISWLGEIPTHWSVILLGRCLASIEQGWSPVAASGEIEADQWAVLTLSAVKRGRFDPAAIKPIRRDAEVPSQFEVELGDLLLTRSNTRERVGDACVVDAVRQKTILCDLIYRLRLNQDRVVPDFLCLQLLSPFGRRQIEQDARGSSDTMPKIAQRHIRAWWSLVPPVPEQHEIVESVASRTAELDVVVKRANQEVALLREYRTRLFADVVTGQLDVRAAAAALPDEPDASDPLDDVTDIDDPADEDDATDNSEPATQ